MSGYKRGLNAIQCANVCSSVHPRCKNTELWGFASIAGHMTNAFASSLSNIVAKLHQRIITSRSRILSVRLEATSTFLRVEVTAAL